jgi:hypothetical protein
VGKGFEILQNTKNRCVLQCDTPKRPHHITKHTINELDTDSKHRKNWASSNEEKDIADIKGWTFSMFQEWISLLWAVTGITTNSITQT